MNDADDSTRPDLVPTARQLADLVGSVPADALEAPTPCSDYAVGDLLDHIGSLAVAFREAATKEADAASSAATAAPGDAARLGDDWWTRIPTDLTALGAAWRDPEAWTGMTAAGGIEMPGEIAGVVAMDELVVHGWDLARALGRRWDCEREALEAARSFYAMFGPDDGAARGAGFGPAVPVAGDAPLIDQVVALSGRNPAWTPATD